MDVRVTGSKGLWGLVWQQGAGHRGDQVGGLELVVGQVGAGSGFQGGSCGRTTWGSEEAQPWFCSDWEGEGQEQEVGCRGLGESRGAGP